MMLVGNLASGNSDGYVRLAGACHRTSVNDRQASPLKFQESVVFGQLPTTPPLTALSRCIARHLYRYLRWRLL